jgi:DNA-binding transcriptional regulator YdaS (Cro superfamily)
MELSAYLQSLPRGGKADFAKRVGISPAFLHQIESGARQVPVEKCAAFERESKGAVTRKSLRKDDWAAIWPELKKRAA